VIASSMSAVAGVLLFSGGLHGYFITATNTWQRIALIVGGLLLIKPGLESDLVGAAIALAVIGTQILARRNAAQPTPAKST